MTVTHFVCVKLQDITSHFFSQVCVLDTICYLFRLINTVCPIHTLAVIYIK